MDEKAFATVPSVIRALSLFELLAESQRGLTLSDLSRRLSLPKSSTYLIVKTLEGKGYLQKHAQTGHYRLGLKLVGLSRKALDNLSLREEARPLLRALMRRTGLTVHMGVLEGSEAVIVEKVEAPGPVKLATWVGRRLDAHCTGVGKALIAHLPEDELNALVRTRGLTRHNARTIVSAARLRRELKKIREQGYAHDDEEDELGLRCVGAPVLDSSGRAVAAISVVGTTSQIQPGRVERLGRFVRAMAAKISSRPY